MPPATKTLVDYVIDARAAYDNTKAQAVTDLASAQAALSAARALVGTRTTALDQLTRDIGALRTQLAAAPSQAEGEHLLGQLQAKIADARAAQHDVLAAQESVDVAAARVTAAQTANAAADAALHGIDAREDDMRARRDEEEAWLAALAGQPMADLGMAVTAAAAPASDAKDRLRTGEMDSALFDRAEERWTLAADRLARADAAASEAADRLAAKRGAVEAAELAYERARSRLRDLAANGGSRLDAALALLHGVTAAPALSQDVVDWIDGGDSHGLVAAATAAKTAEEDRDQKLAALDVAVVETDRKRLAAVVANPDRDIEQVAAVSTARAAEESARSDLNAPQTAYLEPGTDGRSPHDDLAAWEAAVPDSVWRLFTDYERGRAMLAKLADDLGAGLGDALTSAETAYVNALESSDQDARTALALELITTVRDAQAQAARRSEEGRLLGALRGDRWEAE